MRLISLALTLGLAAPAPAAGPSGYAESADISEAAQDAAARAAGFESESRIGPFLRTLISSHHDTLAVAIK